MNRFKHQIDSPVGQIHQGENIVGFFSLVIPMPVEWAYELLRRGQGDDVARDAIQNIA